MSLPYLIAVKLAINVATAGWLATMGKLPLAFMFFGFAIADGGSLWLVLSALRL